MEVVLLVKIRFLVINQSQMVFVSNFFGMAIGLSNLVNGLRRIGQCVVLPQMIFVDLRAVPAKVSMICISHGSIPSKIGVANELVIIVVKIISGIQKVAIF